MEKHNKDCLEKASSIDGKFTEINERKKRAQLRRQETISIKTNILTR